MHCALASPDIPPHICGLAESVSHSYPIGSSYKLQCGQGPVSGQWFVQQRWDLQPQAYPAFFVLHTHCCVLLSLRYGKHPPLREYSWYTKPMIMSSGFISVLLSSGLSVLLLYSQLSGREFISQPDIWSNLCTLPCSLALHLWVSVYIATSPFAMRFFDNLILCLALFKIYIIFNWHRIIHIYGVQYNISIHVYTLVMINQDN